MSIVFSPSKLFTNASISHKGLVDLHQMEIEVTTRGRCLNEVTAEIANVVKKSGIVTGLCTVFIRHTSASLVIQENADPSVRRDLERWLSDLAPESRPWEHNDEGPDDMPAHAKCALTRTQESIPVGGGRLLLGAWQGVYVWEHRARTHRRSLVVHIQGQTA